jgi:hypothetical protein
MLNASIAGNSVRLKQRRAAEVYPFLETYIARKEQQIAEIEQVVERYERKRMVEERAYQTMSPLRRMFSGKKPDHHLAVEYIHYVKKPLEQIRALRIEVDNAKAILKQSQPTDLVTLSDQMEQEIL